MSVSNKNYKQVVNVAGQVSELNTAELECGTLKTSSLLANYITPLPLLKGEIKTVEYTIDSAPDTALGADVAVATVPLNATILGATMKSSGTITAGGAFSLLIDESGIIITPPGEQFTEIDTIMVNNGGVLGRMVPKFPITNGEVQVLSPTPVGVLTVSGTITYFEPSE